MGPAAQKRALLRHTHDIAEHLEFAAANWEPTAFATALVWLDLVPELLATQPFRKAHFEFAKEL
eukprot:1838468-Pleurochrysis_carterae.AAC.1